MSSLQKFEHKTLEINGVMFRIIEAGMTRERADFLQKLLAHNKMETRLEEVPPKTEGEAITYNLLTDNVAFNPVVKVYNRELRTFDNKRVTPDYWNQKTGKPEPNYWDKSKKDF